jgi:hypothetical protein
VDRELDRVGAFSDGVFAIAIMLPVLNIEVPEAPGDVSGARCATSPARADRADAVHDGGAGSLRRGGGGRALHRHPRPPRRHPRLRERRRHQPELHRRSQLQFAFGHVEGGKIVHGSRNVKIKRNTIYRMGNRFSRAFGPTVGYYGVSTDCSDETQSGNVIHETGRPVRLP